MQREFRLHREVGVTLQGLLNAKPYNLYLQAMGFTENSQQESSIVKVVRQLGTCHSSVGNESACNAGNPGLIPRSGRSAGERIGYPTPVSLGFPCGSAGKESAFIVGDLGSIPGLGDPLEKQKATYSSILAGRIPWTAQSMGSLRVGQD